MRGLPAGKSLASSLHYESKSCNPRAVVLVYIVPFSPLVLSWRITKLDSYRSSTSNSNPVISAALYYWYASPSAKDWLDCTPSHSSTSFRRPET